jgi:hypothetical protein
MFRPPQFGGLPSFPWQSTLVAGVDGGSCAVLPSADGIYVANHLMTVGLLKAAEEMGLSCPEDFGLVSFDDYPWLGVFRPRLTTVELPNISWGAKPPSC